VTRLGPAWLSLPCDHEQEFTDVAPGRSVVVDRVDYTLPFGTIGERSLGAAARRCLERLFQYRRAIASADLLRHAPYRNGPPLRVAISGASGTIGRQLAAFLTAGGHEVLRFARGRTAREGEIAWNPASGRIDHEGLEGLDAVVHLAGASIAGGRWTVERKNEILDSRVAGTKLLAEAITVLRNPPHVFVSASAVGYYGDCAETRIDERAGPGAGFLAEVARAWEAATEPADAAGIRTVRTRFGVVVSSRGGAVAKMKLPFQLGLGGPIGTGRQGVSWIALDDAIYAIFHAIRHDDLRGAVNVVAPDPARQGEFAAALGRALHRPAVVPLPAFAVKKIFGQLGEEALLCGQFALPAALRRSGFSWSAPRLSDALER
jgi:uncharacterized protein (TIGR01777 family)